MHHKVADTEAVDPATRGLDDLANDVLVRLLVGQHARAVDAVTRAAPALTDAVTRITACLRDGGRLHYVGAGTSGRLGALDAAECPPTFGTPRSLVQAHLAGGEVALTAAIEGAEDDHAAGVAAMHAVRTGDAVIGLSASGNAPYVLGALAAARAAGAVTFAVTNHQAGGIARAADHAIILETGPEPLAGSTRLLAGTAQKIALNTISTAVMVRLGRVYDNLMIDVVATNAKLRERALRLVAFVGRVDDVRAETLLLAAGGRAKVAVVMARRHVTEEQARALLAEHHDHLRAIIGP